MAHIFGIFEPDRDPPDDDECTHHSPCDDHRNTHIIHMARQRKRRTGAQKSPTPVVNGDSEVETAAREVEVLASKARRVRFRPKDEVMTISWVDVSGPKGDGDNVSIIGTELVDIVGSKITNVYKGVRKIHRR